ncbi:dihydrofolate reductase family protein [Pedobacter sp. KR3-3]|uniref:Dihydrofolate reductase family protein n=1 Tax=Pedobacter albus TaxID=3113905 RepID=A0ABU7I933_9SPHI|nr:dihydrofolate reductase family protein [Pedobacter sp. KR3-3]MEE1945978.1 dihydrofolate reductase family protein [Pedobacter sp. KR3-3]
MRKLIYGINISLDGCCDHTKFSGGNDIHQYFSELLEGADLIIYGRKTYELMVPFWPEVAQTQAMDETANAFAKTFARLKRVLVSRTISSVDDEQTTIIHDNLKEEIIKLKQQPGKAISTGGIELPAQLIEWGLVDEFHILVHPVLVGQGRRLFAEMLLPENQHLKLTASQTLPSGCIALRYEKI